MFSVAGVISWTAFDDSAGVLDQIESGDSSLFSFETGHDRFAHDLRLGHAALPRRDFQMRTQFIGNLTGDRGHDRRIIPNCALGNTKAVLRRRQLCKRCAASSAKKHFMSCRRLYQSRIRNQSLCAFDSLRRQFEGPREDERDRKSNDDCEHD